MRGTIFHYFDGEDIQVGKITNGKVRDQSGETKGSVRHGGKINDQLDRFIGEVSVSTGDVWRQFDPFESTVVGRVDGDGTVRERIGENLERVGRVKLDTDDQADEQTQLERTRLAGGAALLLLLTTG